VFRWLQCVYVFRWWDPVSKRTDPVLPCIPNCGHTWSRYRTDWMEWFAYRPSWVVWERQTRYTPLLAVAAGGHRKSQLRGRGGRGNATRGSQGVLLRRQTQLCVLSTHPTNPARISPRTRTLCITPLDASNTLTTFTSLSALLQRKLNSIAAATSDYNTISRIATPRYTLTTATYSNA
jgi:hypothetical protein